VHTVSVELERRREMRQRKANGFLCHCAYYPFPHKRGTLRMCLGHPLAAVDPSPLEEQYYARCIHREH
jgi:hypothetical protein